MLAIKTLTTKNLIITSSILRLQTRNTFILKRRTPPPLHPKGGHVKKMRAKHFVYELVEDTNIKKQPDLQVILTQYVEGVGNSGEFVKMSPFKAYRDLLMPGLAVYASPENMEKYRNEEIKPKIEDTYSSPYVPRTLSCLSRLVLGITMNKFVPWTIEPWHIKASFRKTGFVVPEHAIEMPPVKISGPDLALQKKEFFVTVTVNKKEKVNVRCRIHHWATGLDRLPWEQYPWKKPLEALIPEQAAVLEKMPLPQ